MESHWDYFRKSDGEKIDVFEVNFIFSITTSKGNLEHELKTQEPDLEFHWIDIKDIQHKHILPTPLKAIIQNSALQEMSGFFESQFN